MPDEPDTPPFAGIKTMNDSVSQGSSEQLFAAQLFQTASFIPGKALLPEVNTTSNWQVFCQHLIKMVDQDPTSTVAMIRSIEVLPIESLRARPYYLPSINGALTEYDKQGRITSVGTQDTVAKGDILNVYANLYNRRAVVAYVGPNCVAFLRSYNFRLLQNVVYVQQPTRSLKLYDQNLSGPAGSSSLVVIGHFTNKVVKPRIETVNAIIQCATDWVSFLQTASIETFNTPELTGFGTSGTLPELEESAALTANPQLKKFFGNLESVTVSNMTKEQLTAYFREMTNITRLSQLVVHLGLQLPRAYNKEAKIKGESDNPIEVQAIDMVGPGAYILVERQKPTTAAVRAFLSQPSRMVYHAAFSPVKVVGKKRGRNKDTKESVLEHPSECASLFQAIRHGVIVGPVEIEEQGDDRKVDNRTVMKL